MTKSRIMALLSSLLLSAFSFTQSEDRTASQTVNASVLRPSEEYDNGKLDTVSKMLRVFERDTQLRMITIANAPQLEPALHLNLDYLRRKGTAIAYSQNGLRYAYSEIKKVNEALQLTNGDTLDISQFRLEKIWGGDQMGNVLFTSYYLPIVEVRREKDSVYKYPIYRKPTSSSLQGLSRMQIDEQGKLNGKNLEMAYAKNYFDIYSMQVQGSGYVQFDDGSRQLFSYGGKNNWSYVSIGKYLIEAGHISKADMSMQAIRSWFDTYPDSLSLLMKNASYVFFKESNAKPSGAAGVPLIDFVSIASDLNYLPKGAILLGEIPILDAEGVFMKHEYRILMVHDTGGAIKGAGRVDLYAGVGTDAGEYAGRMKHYGRLWVILPK